MSCMLRVCELFGKTICYMFGCGCYFVVKIMLAVCILGGMVV